MVLYGNTNKRSYHVKYFRHFKRKIGWVPMYWLPTRSQNLIYLISCPVKSNQLQNHHHGSIALAGTDLNHSGISAVPARILGS